MGLHGNSMNIRDFIIIMFNLPQERIEKLDTHMSDGTFVAHLQLWSTHPTCELCGGETVSKGFYPYHFKNLDTNGIPTEIHWNRRRYKCKECGCSFAEDNLFTPEGFNVSYPLLDSLIKEFRNVETTIKNVANRYHVSPTSVSLYLDSFLIAPQQPLPENLGIDEKHSSMAKYKGKYLCVFVDNNDRKLVEIFPNRSKSHLTRELEKRSKEDLNRVKYVTIDMWKPYKDISQKFFKTAIVSVDNFHVVKEICQCFTKLRVNLMKQQPHESSSYYLLKHWHWLLEKEKVNLDNEPKYNQHFKAKLNHRQLYFRLLNISPTLNKAYNLKELYRHFNETATEADAEERFYALKNEFVKANIPEYEPVITMFNNWGPEIINSFKRPYNNRKQSNAFTENINGKLNILITVSNGISNFERFRSRALFALNPGIMYSIKSRLTSKKREGKPRGEYKKADKLSISDDNSKNLTDKEDK